MTQTKKFARIIYPGSLYAEESVKEVNDTNPEYFELPNNAIGVKFFEKTCVEINNETLWGQEKNHTGWFYRGKIVTKDTPGIGDILRNNLTFNGWKSAVQFGGVTYPVTDNDQVYWEVK